jgi:T5SS/PEP-CTERM-associated repeat protein
MGKNRKSSVAYSLALLAILANGAFGGDLYFNMLDDSGNWNTIEYWTEYNNGWSPGWVPTTNDVAIIREPKTAIIDTAATAKAVWLGEATWAENSTLDVVSGGSLTIPSTWADNVRGMKIGDFGQGTLNVYDGGAVDVQNIEIWMGTEGVDADGLLHMHGGSLRVAAGLVMDHYNNGGSAHVQVDGGVMEIGWLFMRGDGASMDFGTTNGVIKITADETSDVADMIAAGKITAFGGTNASMAVRYDYDVSNPGITTIWAGNAPPASPVELQIATAGSNLDFTWNVNSGKLYDLESTESLMSLNWAPYTNGVTVYEDIPPSSTGTNVLSGVSAIGPTRFFRIMEK